MPSDLGRQGGLVDTDLSSRTSTKGRLGSARNTGVEQASSEIVAFLDDDAAADPDWLKFMVAPYDQPEVVAVGGAPLPVFETPRPAWFPPQLDWVFGCYYDGLPTELAPAASADRCVHVGALAGPLRISADFTRTITTTWTCAIALLIRKAHTRS